MTPRFTSEQRALRTTVRALLADPEIDLLRRRHHAATAAGDEIDVRPAHRRLGERGLLAVGWPRQYGGGGHGAVEAAIVHQEIVRAGLPDLNYVVSICYVGDFLLNAGSQDVRERYLPRLASGELNACTLYSEPDAGSDLGSLSTRIEPVAGGYRLYGTKVHAQGTLHADYGLVAARIGERAEAKQDGITLLWVPLRAPGVGLEQVPGLSDHAFSTVVLDGVEVPADHVVGPVGQGWPLLNEALTLERTGFEAHLKARSWLDAVIERAERAGLLADPLVADQVVALDTRVRAGGTLAWTMVGKQAAREIDSVGAAMSKWYNTELGRPIARLALEVEGPAGALSGRYSGSPRLGRAEHMYREAPGLTLSAGTSEIMLYSISTGHLRVHTENSEPSRLDEPHRQYRRRLSGFLRTSDVAWSTLHKGNVIRLTLPTSAGGLDGRLGESLVVAETLGRVLARGPWLATVSLAEALARGGPEHPLWPWVRAVADGKHTVAVSAHLTGGPDTVALAPADSGFRLTGRAELVPFADSADFLLVRGITSDGDRFVLLDRRQPGVSIEPVDDLSETRFHRVTFDGTPVDCHEVLWRATSLAGRDLLARLWLRQAGYLLGLAQGALDLTLGYTKRRKQFGTTIATFQHVSFRLAELATRLHAARQLLHRLADDPDHTGPAHSTAASTLAMLTELAGDTTATALQLHGAHGLTDSAEIQRYYRQAAVEGLVFGTPRYLRALAFPDIVSDSRCS
ncbi:acyl-CoA dehydrogenase family protein [Amycolatopsis magusensis]|uniref:Alkylation response protein AidB-like acyl-CoA dehydrogenase n=1 Tax=Amycolatopsis magusensis TaxID=882444 RepID=A0ABS4PU40_9PSEU|nr:acyl-CoA dehydrogenase family protein [Amycolatopsis magusensis]MBP2182944.1 alkylation response protein AidB-like acyl-CoA dehydrogenase [Amycolatopsis magusensis]